MDPLLAPTLGAVALSHLAVADGVDLGIGMLFPLARRERDRDALMRGVTPFWHGNEAWLALGAVGLCAALPLGYHRLPQAFLAPILTMASALILRGIVIDPHVQGTRPQRVRIAALAGGSLVAAVCQGLILGGWAQLAMTPEGFFGEGLFDCLSTPGILCAAVIVSGYLLLGSGFWFCARLVMSGPKAHAYAWPCEVRSGSHRIRPGAANGDPDHVRTLAPGE